MGTSCELWLGYVMPNGYGRVSQVGGVNQYAHRVAYETANGPIPDGLQIDHLCRNRACVNPNHLETVTQGENIRRGEPANRTHCPQNHPYDETNTYIQPSGSRVCRTCRKLKERKRRANR